MPSLSRLAERCGREERDPSQLRRRYQVLTVELSRCFLRPCSNSYFVSRSLFLARNNRWDSQDLSLVDVHKRRSAEATTVYHSHLIPSYHCICANDTLDNLMTSNADRRSLSHALVIPQAVYLLELQRQVSHLERENSHLRRSLSTMPEPVAHPAVSRHEPYMQGTMLTDFDRRKPRPKTLRLRTLTNSPSSTVQCQTSLPP